MLGWRPRDFWRSTPRELGAALAGRLRAMPKLEPRGPVQELGDDGQPLPPGMKRSDVAELLAWHEQCQGQAA